MEELIKLKNEIKENPNKVYEISYLDLVALNGVLDDKLKELDEQLKINKQKIQRIMKKCKK